MQNDFSGPKADRQRALAELIRSRPLASQSELADALAERGFGVTQATVSRDIEQIGAVRVKSGGAMRYVLSEQSGTAPMPGQLAAVLRDWVQSIAPAGTLVVLKTPPGSAHLVGVALDRSELEGVAGTLCGDDTVFMATEDAASARSCAAALLALRSGAS
jgi:transcriptional regulator of arginine metabolism